MKSINTVLTKISLGLIWIYQRTLSPDKGIPSLRLKGRICMHEPHCSEYGKLCLQRYGFFHSIGKITNRVFSCTGWMHKIYDPEFYKVVFFSSAPIGVPFLEKLHEDKRFDVTGVVTMPDAPAGRGMKMQENVIKTKAKGLHTKDWKKKIILLHGFAGKPHGWRKDELKQRCKVNEIEFFAPELIENFNPTLSWQLQQLTELYGNIVDKNTIIIGHSLGAPLAAHFVEKMNKKIDKLICIGPANPTQSFETIDDPLVAENHVWLRKYIDSPINYQKVLKNTNQHIIYLSDNDPYIPYTETKEYFEIHTPKAKILSFKKHRHFSSSDMTTFAPLLEEISSSNDYIQTPNSLRLDSKKYADEAEQFQQWLANKKPDFLVVIAYGKIIPQHILDIPTFWPINVHGSILPKYRGASPIQSVFLHDEKETGITIMKMDAWLDTGDMIDIAKFPIAFDWTAKDIITKMQDIWPQFLADTLRKYGKWLLWEVKQDDTQATHCGKIEKEEWLIDPYTDSIQSVYQKYRAYILWPKIYFVHNDKRVIVEQLVLDEKLFAQHKAEPLIQNNTTNPCVTTLIVKPEWSKSQSRDDFVKGYM